VTDRNRPTGDHIGNRFPNLSQLSTEPGEFQKVLGLTKEESDGYLKDFGLTDKEFGTDWRRGKQARLAAFQSLEDRLALEAFSKELDGTRPVLANLEEIGKAVPNLLDALPTDIVDFESAKVAYRLASINLQPTVQMGAHGFDATRAELKGLSLDEPPKRKGQEVGGYAVEILRESLCTLGKPLKDTDLAERHGITKQSVAERRRRLIRQLTELGERPPFAALRDLITTRIDKLAQPQCLHLDDPFVKIAQLPPESEQEFPDISDVVSVGIWLAFSGDLAGIRPLLRSLP